MKIIVLILFLVSGLSYGSDQTTVTADLRTITICDYCGKTKQISRDLVMPFLYYYMVISSTTERRVCIPCLNDVIILGFDQLLGEPIYREQRISEDAQDK